MTRLTFLILLAALPLSLLPESAVAQEPHHSRISIVHPGFAALKVDLESVINLTTPVEKQQWENIEDYIDMFQIGIDGNRPVRVDILTGLTPVCYLAWVPLKVPEDAKKNIADEFRDSLDAFGFTTTRDSQDRNLYRIENAEGAADMGWLRILPDIKYGVFVLTTDRDDMQLLRQIVLRSGDPGKDVETLLSAAPPIGIGAEGINAAESPEDQARRREAFLELRKISMDTIQKRPDETKTAFELRQALFGFQLDEGERLMVEAREIRAAGTLNRDMKTAELTFTATAIAETSLAESIALFGQLPDAFATVPRLDGSALSIRLNHPIDEMRQTNALEAVSLAQTDLNGRVDASADMEADEKEASKKLLTGIVEVIQDGIRSGNINGFLESVPAQDGQFTTIAAVSAPTAPRLNEILPLLASAGKKNTMDQNVATAGTVVIHRLQLAEGYVDVIDRVFGTQRDLYIGVADAHVWMASGPNALETLTKTIAELGQPEGSTTCLRIDVNGLPWAKRLEEIAKTAPEGKTPEGKEKQRKRARTRARAIAAMETSDDLMTLDVTVEGGVVSGKLTVDTGILRFIGKMMSAFSKENLDG